MTLSPTRRRLFALFSVVLILTGQELLFRPLFPIPEVVGFNRLHYQLLVGTHPRLRDTLNRGLVYDRLQLESQPDGFREIHSLNLYGFRGPDFSVEPTQGRQRILLVGDSITEGQGAADSSTIAMNIGRLMNAERVPSEVINLGVIAASLPELTRLTRDAVGLLTPKTVVLILYANDLPAPSYSPELDLPAPTFERRRSPAWMPRIAALAERLLSSEPIYRRWPHRPMPFFPAVPDPANPWSRASAMPPNIEPALYRAMLTGSLSPWLKGQADFMPEMLANDFSSDRAAQRFLRRIRDLCQSAGVRLIVAYVPFCGVVHPRYATSLIEVGMRPAIAHALSRDPIFRRQNRFLASLCANLQLPFADTTEDLVAAERDGVPQYWNFDTHPRPAGYATIAKRIRRALQDEDQTARARVRGVDAR